MKQVCVLIPTLLFIWSSAAMALDRPWIADTYFYWYTWDYDTQQGNWIGGVYNTPLTGYYDSRSYEDNLRAIHTASEWGITHHFMDFWGHGWEDLEGHPREQALLRATEALQQRGYDAFMSFYQDGEDFQMGDFAANVDQGRQVRWLFENFGKSPALPLLDGKPVWLVYGRNGAPKTDDDEGRYRTWLRQRYGTVDRLNAAWGTSLAGFDEATLNYGRGQPRADAIAYQYEHWQGEMDRMNERVRQELGLPGILPSFDVAFQPYMGFGYSDFARVLHGPHTYAGIFGQPQEQDVERFIQTVVGKYHNTPFFDTYKNFYCDWEVRTPGTWYPPEPCHFDRFWVGNLMRYVEAMLHLSWNEWWEGSNLEPCWEHGKTYCQKNLLYATIMKQCFGSIRDWSAGARVGVLLSDWHWLAGGQNPDDIYASIQAVRRANLTFDLIPDEFVTTDKLAAFDVIIAPAAGVGFGRNAEGEAIADLLKAWAAEGEGHKLIVSADESLWPWLGLETAPPKPTKEQGGDMTVHVDVGVEGDERFLLSGSSFREDWGAIPADAYGAAREHYTVRWTPAVGSETTFLLPLSPGRDHVLRLAGNAFADNHVRVLINGREAGAFDLKAGPNKVEVPIPASAVGDRKLGILTLGYEKANIPSQLAPERHPSEMRVCNLAIDWLQLSTANMPESTEQRYEWPQERIAFAQDAPAPLGGQKLTASYRPHANLAVPKGTVLSRYATDGAPRDVAIPVGRGEALYVNGSLGGVEDPRYLETLLSWAGARADYSVRGENVIGARLRAGDTDIVLAYNYDITNTPEVTCRLATAGRPVSEVQALTRDGRAWRDVNWSLAKDGAEVVIRDRLHYYGVYQVVYSPMQVVSSRLAVAPGGEAVWRLRLRNKTARRVDGTLSLVPHLPSLSAGPVLFGADGREEFDAQMTLRARDDADWGEKTIVLALEVDGQTAYLWRPLTVERPPDLQVQPPVVDARTPEVTVASEVLPFIANADATEVALTGEGQTVSLGSVPSGGEKAGMLKVALPEAAPPRVVTRLFDLSYRVGEEQRFAATPLRFAVYPDSYPRLQDAQIPVLAFNGGDEYLENALVQVRLPKLKVAEDQRLYVRERGGAVVPSQYDPRTRELLTLGMLPPQGCGELYVCIGRVTEPPTDLRVEAEDLGSGQGTLTVRNSHLALTLSEAAGGTATQFTSAASGADYAGSNTFGVAYGSWGRYDPLKPAVTTPDYIGTEEKTYQADSPARITVTEQGPMRVTAVVEWDDARVSARQTYQLFAHQDYFTIATQVRPKRLEGADELVALDARFARNQLAKIYPNFTGIVETFGESLTQHGWREVPYVPAVASFMVPSDYPESVSLILQRTNGIDKYRHGFWPETRPQSGPAKWAELELVSTQRRPVDALVYVLVRPGHQVVPERFKRSLDNPPLVLLPPVKAWLQPPEPPFVPATIREVPWWNPYWHYRVPLTVREAQPGQIARVELDLQRLLPARETLDPESVRVVEVAQPPGLWGETPSLYTPGVLRFAITDRPHATADPRSLADRGPGPKGSGRRFYVYLDTQATGPKRPPTYTLTGLSDELLDPSFEQGGAHWQLGEAELVSEGAHSGRHCVRLQLAADQGTRVVSNASLAVRPNTTYAVRLWAKTQTPGAFLMTNFFQAPPYDFQQIRIDLEADGQWHEYQAQVPTGEFPPTIRPVSRIWIIGKAQTVWIDDVTARPMIAEVSGPAVTVGALERGA